MNGQLHEYEDLIQHLKTNGTVLDDSFQIACLLDKLPPSWLKFPKKVSHIQGVMTLTQVINSLRIEEQHRVREKGNSEKLLKVYNIERLKPNKFQKHPF